MNQLDVSTSRANRGHPTFSDNSSDVIIKSMMTILNGYEAFFHENQPN
jgi:hypothetical protein